MEIGCFLAGRVDDGPGEQMAGPVPAHSAAGEGFSQQLREVRISVQSSSAAANLGLCREQRRFDRR